MAIRPPRWHAPGVADSVELDELRAWMTACDPRVPVGPTDPRFVDFYRFSHRGEVVSLRGDGVGAGLPLIQEAIGLADGQSCHLFSGFSGTGKSSELLGLRRDLEAQGYVVLIADALDYLNLRRALTSQELLVVAAAAFGDVASAHVGKNLVKADYLTRFTEFLQRDIDLGGLPIPGLGELKLGISINQPFWIAVRDRLAVSIGKLRDHAHAFVAEVVAQLRRKHADARGVVFVLDSLEQVRGTLPADFDSVVQSVVEVFVNQASLLRFPCHVVYTIPPYVRQLALGTLYDHVTDVLPAIKVHERGSPEPYAAGIDALCEVVRRRIPVARIFGEDEALLRELAAASGGHVRLLLTFVRDVLLRARQAGLPVDRLTIERVLRRHREDAKHALWRERLPVLRDVLERGELPSMSRGELPILAGLLEDYIVLCYRNGEGWYDVHPLVRDNVQELVTRKVEPPPGF